MRRPLPPRPLAPPAAHAQPSLFVPPTEGQSSLDRPSPLSPLSRPPPRPLAPLQVIEGQYWMAPISALWLFAAAAVSEAPRAHRTHRACRKPCTTARRARRTPRACRTACTTACRAHAARRAARDQPPDATRRRLTRRRLTASPRACVPACPAWPALSPQLPRALASDAASIVAAHGGLFLLSASLGFFVNICTFLVIKSTNSVTLKVLGTARNAGLVVFSAGLLGEHVGALELAGYSCSLGFFALYNYYKVKKL